MSFCFAKRENQFVDAKKKMVTAFVALPMTQRDFAQISEIRSGMKETSQQRPAAAEDTFRLATEPVSMSQCCTIKVHYLAQHQIRFWFLPPPPLTGSFSLWLSLFEACCHRLYIGETLLSATERVAHTDSLVRQLIDRRFQQKLCYERRHLHWNRVFVPLDSCDVAA